MIQAERRGSDAGVRLPLDEREWISHGLVAEASSRKIARELERPASTVS